MISDPATRFTIGQMVHRIGDIPHFAHQSMLIVSISLSSNSFSILPAKPKIFHGRKSELHDIVETLQKESPRIAILGAGGMGKTSLAKAALHHPEVAAKYQDRFFIAS